ncbi:MAG: hypothetical protein ACLTBR_00325 [Anaerostipes sp.]|uniref:hypothetical protein n=1 Tax=Anaerostipes sp. TaxID=1872530 RepID=UPI00399612E9
MKKFMVMFATLIMSFAFAISVMAAPSPDDEYYDDNPGQDQVDDNTQFNDDEFYKDGDDESSSSTTTSESVSPKTGDQGAPASLVYIALAAAAMSVYAAKRLKEQY